MKERQILFSGPMVRAILDGRKTQTRRIVKQVPHWEHCGKDIMEWGLSDCYTEEDGTHWLDIQTDVDDNSHKEIFCPYGQPGDRLWVRETWTFGTGPVGDEPPGPDNSAIIYRASWDVEVPETPLDGAWKPSIHMPRWASRITLEITGIRVERLNDISEGDAIDEGINSIRTHEFDRKHFPEWRKEFDNAIKNRDKPLIGPLPSTVFRSLWESINGPGSWDANPWVWVVEFRKVDHIPGATKKV